MSLILPARESSTALVVVDVQNGFVNEKSAQALPSIVRLIQHWQSNGWPIYFTKFVNLPGSKWEQLIGWRRLREAPETDFHSFVSNFTNAGIIVEKSNLYTSLTGQLLADVSEGSIADAVVCGIATESCVLATALSLFEVPSATVRPFVVSDASASHAGQFAHEAGITVIERFIGRQQILRTADILGAS